MIRKIISSLDTVSFINKKRYEGIFDEVHLPNNAYFLGFTRYDAQKVEMKREMKEKANGNIKEYLEGLKLKT